MARAPALGHMACPDCGFPDAEIRMQKSGERLYRYCPECNAQFFARTPAQEKAMRERIALPPADLKPVKPAPEPTEKPQAKPAPAVKKPAPLADALAFMIGK